MAYIKFVLAIVLALGASEIQAATVAQPRDLGIFIEALIELIREIITSVDNGIQNAKPIVDKLLAQLVPEVADALQKVIDKVLAFLAGEEVRIDEIIKAIQAALEKLEGIKDCTEEVSEPFGDILKQLQKDVLAVIIEAEEANAEGLDQVKEGIESVVEDLRKLFDDKLVALVNCWEPGTQDCKECNDNVLAEIKEKLNEIKGTAILLLLETINVVGTFGGQCLNGTVPLIDQAKSDIDPLLEKVCVCVAAMS